MGKTSSKFIYAKTCKRCLSVYWTTAKRTPFGLCNECLKKSNKKKRKPAGNLTEEQALLHINKMQKECKNRVLKENKEKSKDGTKKCSKEEKCRDIDDNN